MGETAFNRERRMTAEEAQKLLSEKVSRVCYGIPAEVQRENQECPCVPADLPV